MNWKNEIYNYIYINENSRYLKSNSKVVEGGLARNYAFMRWMKANIINLKSIDLSDNKAMNVFKVFVNLIFKKNYNIIFQYVTVGVPIHSNKFLGKILSDLYLYLVRFSSKHNNIIFDVSDIKYEQLIDLKLVNDNIKQIRKFENKFFRLSVKFIFASESMRDYACKKYQIQKENTDICINGGNRIIYNKKSSLEKYIDKDKINYVYAGSLNKGRQIEEMIINFPENDKFQLILMGADGEWIEDNSFEENIIYLGAVEETEAHYLVSKCDVGLIPYDDCKLYYNIAYPTKLSFYITAGIPFLSTPVIEVKKINEKYDIGYIGKINNWSSIINNITFNEILGKKLNLNNVKEDFYWDKIFIKNKFIK